MKRNEDDKRGWILVGVFLLTGLLCVFLTGNLALRSTRSWSLNADMRSRLNPDSAYATLPTGYVLQPIDPAILTPPLWIENFLTPGQTYPTRPPRPTAVTTESIPPTQIPSTLPPTAFSTPTLVFWPATQTSYPVHTRTSRPPADTDTPIVINPATATPTTPTGTPTGQTPGTAPVASADLQVTITDGLLFYTPGSTLTYTVVVSNNGPSPVAGAQVLAALPSQVLLWSWACIRQDNGASGCDSTSLGNLIFNDTVNLPMGASITYAVTTNTSGIATDSLRMIASIKEPVDVLDPIQGNNSATDLNEVVYTLPYQNIGTYPDGPHNILISGSSLTLAFNTPLVVNGHPSWDLVFYELRIGSGIGMDWTLIQIGDGTNWYNVFYWGDGIPDTNSNLNINVIGGTEDDNRDLTAPPLYTYTGSAGVFNTGIVMELDGVVPNGTYPYIRFIAPPGDLDNGTEIDAVAIMP